MKSYYLREAQIHYQRRPLAAPPHWDTKKKVKNSVDVAEVLRCLIGTRIVESLVVLALDGRGCVVGYHEAGRGGVSSCGFTLADVFRYPILTGCSAMIIAHNHPSGSVAPSEEDVAMTDKLVKAGRLLGLQILDHVIVSAEGSFSFLDEGLMARFAASAQESR